MLGWATGVPEARRAGGPAERRRGRNTVFALLACCFLLCSFHSWPPSHFQNTCPKTHVVSGESVNARSC